MEIKMIKAGETCDMIKVTFQVYMEDVSTETNLESLGDRVPNV
jgi:hypothetical protein